MAKRDVLENIGEDIRAIKGTALALYDQRPYTSNHPTGPYEVSLTGSYGDNAVTDGLDSIGDAIRNAASDVSDAQFETNLALIDTNFHLEWIRGATDSLPEIAGTLDEICDATYESLEQLAIGIGLQIEAMEAQAMYHEDTIDALGAIRDELQDGFETLGYGLDAVGEKVDNVYHIIRVGNRKITKAIRGGFLGLGSLMTELDERRSKDMQSLATSFATSLARNFQILDRQEERRHEELVSTIKDVASNRYAFEAGEKYKSASAQYKVGNYRMALRDIRDAIRSKSDHIPSLMLYGKIAARRTQWAKAKDAFYQASEHALLQKDMIAYQVAVIELSRVERLVGNTNTGDAIIRDVSGRSRETFNIHDLSHVWFEYIRIRIPQLLKQYKDDRPGLTSRLYRLFTNFLYDILKKNPEYLDEVRTGSHFAPARKEFPNMQYGPLFEVVDVLSRPPFQQYISATLGPQETELSRVEQDIALSGGKDIKNIYDLLHQGLVSLDLDRLVKSPELLDKIRELHKRIITSDIAARASETKDPRRTRFVDRDPFGSLDFIIDFEFKIYPLFCEIMTATNTPFTKVVFDNSPSPFAGKKS